VFGHIICLTLNGDIVSFFSKNGTRQCALFSP